jgi:hypothetical protein
MALASAGGGEHRGGHVPRDNAAAFRIAAVGLTAAFMLVVMMG